MDRLVHEGPVGTNDESTVPIVPVSDDDVERIPRVVAGRFTILSKIGEGGMGKVYKAHDSTLGREVALKCVGKGRLAAEFEDRAVLEARALAKVSHPNVVAIYDVLIDQGQLVLAMEYVPGSDLKRWLEQATRSVESILDVFIQAGLGLAAVHERGLLHRDFKPANVLVGEDGRARVVDFGIARFDDGAECDDAPEEATVSDGVSIPSTDLRPSLTRTGVTMGTPTFMAPEQHLGGAIDHRADVYAFCIALWMALVGRAPFVASGKDHYAALVREKYKGPPPWPKTVEVPRHVVAAIERGMAARPGDRWPSMRELVAALSKTSSRAKWIRMGVAAACLVVGSIGAGVYIQTRRTVCGGGENTIAEVYDGATAELLATRFTNDAPPYVAALWPAVRARLEELRSGWVESHRSVCEATRIQATQSEQVMDLRMSCLFRMKARLATVVELLAQADATTLGNAPRMLDAIPPLSRCDDVAWLQEETPPNDDPDEAMLVDEARRELGRIETLAAAGQIQRAAEEIEVLVQRTSAIDYGPYRAELAHQRGSLWTSLSRNHEAADELRRATELALELHMLHTAAKAANDLAFTLGNGLGKIDVANAWTTMAYSLVRGRPEARRLEITVLGTRATLHRHAGNYAEAQADYEAAIALGSLDDSTTAQIAALRDNLGGILVARGRFDRAEQERREAWQVFERVLGEHHPETLRAGINVASTLMVRGEHEAAAALYEDLIPRLEAALGPDNLEVAGSRLNLAMAWSSMDRHEPAIAVIEQSIETFETQAPENHHAAVQLQTNLADVLLRAGQPERALATVQRAVSIGDRFLGDEHPERAKAQGLHGEILMQAGRFDEAVKALDDAANTEGLDLRRRARFAFESGKASWERGEAQRGRERAAQALRLLEGLPADERNDAELQASVQEIEGWLATHERP